MSESKQLLHLVQSFFQDYLAAQRALSPNTVLAYRDALKLFLSFVARCTGKQTSRLRMEDLQADKVLAFLEDIEASRHNRVVTRNLRLAALRTFFHYLISEDTVRAGQYQKIVAIPLKRAPRVMMGYLEVGEIRAVLDAIDRCRPSGRRDYTLINFLYNTGARVQEVIDLKVGGIRLAPPPVAIITGKGGKTRVVPLWSETVALLDSYLKERGVQQNPEARLFINARGEPLTRFGIRYILRTRLAAASQNWPNLARKHVSPHTLRHSTAMHMLQSGVDLVVIQNWLGHVQLATTHAYVEIDLEMKRKALSACAAPGETAEGLPQIIEKNQDVIRWLESL